jgi:hypothetical protein
MRMFAGLMDYVCRPLHIRVALEIESKARIAAEQMSTVLVARLESMTERATKAETKVEQLEQQHRELYKRIV